MKTEAYVTFLIDNKKIECKGEGNVKVQVM